MAKQSIATLKTWFETNDFPTQQQFYDWMESYFHLDDPTVIFCKNGRTAEYNDDAAAVLAGLVVGDYYVAGDEHLDGVRQGTPCRVNS